MKPKVAILGHWNPTDVPSNCPFEFVPKPYAHHLIPNIDVAALAELASTNDLIIIDDLVGGLLPHIRDNMQGWRGGRAKICYWVHHVFAPDYFVGWDGFFDGIAMAHRQCLKLFDQRAFWVPCSVIFQARKDFRRASIMRWDFGCIARHYPQAERNVFMDRWRECFEAWGHNVFLGEVNSSALPFMYGCTETVFNIPSAGDLNMRFFEALCAGATLITTECEDMHDARFADMMDAVWLVPKTLNEEELKQSVREMKLSKRRPVQKKALDKHLVINRYIEIAEHIL